MLFRSATHGRGFWVLDNITPLRQITDEVVNSNFLFRPAGAYILPPPSENGTPQPRDEPLAENQPNGAIIDYYLKSAGNSAVTLEILNPAGELITKRINEEESFGEIAISAIDLLAEKTSLLESQELLNSYVPVEHRINVLDSMSSGAA